MAETLEGRTREDINASVARGEESKWNVNPITGELLSEGYTYDYDLEKVAWVGSGPEPNEKVDNSVDTIPEEETVEEVTPTSDPLRKIFDYAADEKRKWYRGSYEEFKNDYSTEEKQLKLYDILKKKKLYRLSKGEFLNQYFPIPNEVDSTEIKGETSRPDVVVTEENTASNGEESSTEYELQTQGNKKAWGRSVDGGEMEVVDANEIPEDWFNDPKFKEVYDKENKPQKLKDADAEKVAREALTNFYANVSGMPKWALPYVTNFTGGAAGLVSGLFKTLESTAENLIGMTADEQREDGVNPVSEALDSFHDFTDAFDTKYYDEKGDALQVDQLLEKGDYGKALKLASEQAAESAPSMIASVYNPLIGGALMGVSTTGTTYKEDLESRPEEALNNVIGNAMWAGSSEFLTEWAGGKFFRSLNGLKKSGAAEDVIRDYTKNYVVKFVGRTMGSGVGESITESVNSLITDGGEVLFYDDKKTQKELISNVINSAVPALLMGGFGGGISSVNKQEKSNVYKYVAPQKWKQEHLNLGKQIFEASNDLDQAEGSSVKANFRIKLKKLQKAKQTHEQALVDGFDNMSNKELIDYGKNIDAVNANLNIINNNKYSQSAQKDAEQKNIELIQDNLNSLGQEYTGKDIETEKIIGEALKASETIEESLKKVKGINREDLEIKVLKNDKDIDALSGVNKDGVKNSDGAFIGKDENGKATIYINQNVAAMAGATNVLGHELLHYMVSRKFKTDNKSMEPLVDELKTYLKDNHSDVFGRVQQRIDKFYTNENGTIKDGALEEYLNVFSDLIATQKIDIKEVNSKGLAGGLNDVMAGFGFGEIKLDSAKDVISFLSTYNKNINRKGLLGKLMGAKILNVGLTSKKLTKGETKGAEKKSMSTPLEAINKLIPKNIKTKKDYDAFVQDRRAFPAIFNATMGDGVISNYVKSKSIGGEYQGAIESVQNRLTNFDPEATRADGTTVGPEGFGEFIFANTRFGKLDSKKKLFEAGEKAKKTTTIDTKEAKELEDTSTATEVEDKSKARNLRDFDIEVEDGLVNAEIEAEVEALLEKNPDDIEVQMEKLILGDIRKSLDGIVGKIAKNKKTGKRGPTAEYEAFIRNEYLEVVQSLGMETIRTAYRPWFESKKIRTEKYKGVSPKTGKVTNYVKDVFENKTNKREYIRWFLEGNERNITERRTALIRRIARRKAKIATDNYIESNSSKLDKVAEAKLRKISRAIENTQVEQKSFDSIKYSKNKMLPTRLSQEFSAIFERGNNGKPLVQKGTIWTGYVNPYTNEPQSFVDKGRIWEQAFANYFMKNGIEGLKVLSEIASEVDGMADFVFEYNGKVENHELKASIAAFMGSISISNLENGKIKFATNTHNNLLEQVDTKKFMEGYKKRVDFVNKGIERLNKKIKDPSKQYALIDYDVTSGKPQNIPYELYMDKKGFGNKMFYQLKADQAVIENHYKSKKDKNGIGVRSLSFVGTKTGNMSFGLDSESILNLPRLDADVDVNFTFRNGGSKMVNGNKVISLSLGVQFKISKLNNKAENSVDITIKEDLQKALGINFSKSIEGRKINSAINFSRSTNNPTKGITVLDFDDTLATSKSNVLWTAPDGTTGKLTAEEFAKQGADLLAQGYVYDFSEFNKVVKGKKAPLFEKALKLQSKFGPENMFILTARPAESAESIFEFIKANGLNIPLKNITGLANSTAEAKALWMVDKVSEGYNDFYFADDALQNVQAVDNILEQFDVKRKVQQARIKFSKSMSEGFNDILENVTGIESEKRFSDIKARKRGAEKGKFRVFIPPSHEDFVGLLYNFMGKGKEGNNHRDFFEQALVRPLNRAYKEIDTAKQAVANDFKELNKQFSDVKNKLIKNTPDGDFTFQDAIRVYLWNKHGYKIPGLSTTDQQNLVELVSQDAELKAYAETLNVISKQDKYVDPGPNWNTGNIRIDLVDATGRVGRKAYFAEFNENAEALFSEENLNKIEAAYGSSFRSALEDMLHRIKTGVNRPKGASAKPNMFMNWLNASVAGVMFFNTRSALLQQMSNVNYLNFADNNIFKAGLAFANQKQYWKDFAMIFNSDMMKQRRGGLGTDINGAELAEAIKKARPGNIFDQVAIITGKALKLGFLPTQIGDNIAIATGGAAFYRNRVNKYIKDGMSIKDAETAAFTDFQNITQSTQQSARPDMTSQQQASWIGKLVLNFLNTPSQYNRIIKKAGSDIKNRRMTPPNTSQTQSDMSNMSRILYYGAAQNLIFYSLQTALFAVMFGSDDEDDDKRAEQFLKKKERVINGTIDTILRGSGIYGVAISTLKNMTIKFMEQREKGYNKDESAVLMEGLNFSPVLGIKARRIVNAEKTLNYNKKVIAEMETLDIDNPVWSAVTNIIQATTGAPLNKMYQKTINLRNAMDSKYTAFQRALFLSGYTTWSLNLGDTEKMKQIKQDVKDKTKAASKEKSKIKREEKKKEKEEENKAIIEENKKKSEKDGICSAVSKGGVRCKKKAINGGMCTIHESAAQRKDGKKVQCRKRKSNGKRCGMKTTNKSGFCYYHD